MFSCCINAQTWAWAQPINSADYETSLCATPDGFGHIFVAGYFTGSTVTIGSNTFTNIYPGRDDIYLAKYDGNGNVRWAKSFGGHEHDGLYDIATDSAGNCIIIGAFASNYISFGSTTLYNTGGGKRNIFMAKLDSLGNMLWVKNYGGIGDDYGLMLATDKEANIFFGGSFDNNIVIGTQTLTSSFGSNCFLAKCDPNGNQTWAQTSGGGSDIATDDNGCAYITGSFMGSTVNFGSITFNNTSIGVGSSDAFIAKYDPDGAVIWAIATSGSYSEEIKTIKTDKAGNVYFTGNSFGAVANFGIYNLATTGIINSFVGKLSPSGNITWLKQLKNPRVNYTYGLSTGEDGSLYLGGTYDLPLAFGTTTISGSGNINAYVAKYDTAGVFQWATGFSGNDVTQLIAVAANNNSEVYVFGKHNCTPGLAFGSITLNAAGGNDVYLAKLNFSAVGVKELADEEKTQAIVYPNPNTGTFKIAENFKDGTELILTDILGRNVFSKQLNKGENEVETQGLAKSLYHYSILQNRSLNLSGKVVIE